ncbi:MAG: dipeptide epimerase [Pseudomonadota bacterium]
MKITAIRTRIENFELSRPYEIAFRKVDAVQNNVVEVDTNIGLTGVGVGSPEPHVTGETPDACSKALKLESLNWLIGHDVRTINQLSRELARRMPGTPAARAAIDIALYDLLGQFLQRPLVDVLGRTHDSLPTSITIGIKSLEETLVEAEEYFGRGFRTLKVKLGHSVEEDIERLRKLRGRYRSTIDIRVDPNQGYSPEDLTRFHRETSALDLEFVEQPMDTKLDESLWDLPAGMRKQLAADESLLNESDALRLINRRSGEDIGACGIFVIKLMKCGGIFSAKRIADIADVGGVQLMWGCMDESIVSITAALHAAFSSPATRYIDLDGSLDLARDIVSGGFELEDGKMRTTRSPGLGVTLLADQDEASES